MKLKWSVCAILNTIIMMMIIIIIITAGTQHYQCCFIMYPTAYEKEEERQRVKREVNFNTFFSSIEMAQKEGA